MGRRFNDAPECQRCAWTVRLRDGSEAQCGRRKTGNHLCAQHQKISDRWSCDYCGGNDEFPTDHCVDCARPSATKDTTK